VPVEGAPRESVNIVPAPPSVRSAELSRTYAGDAQRWKLAAEPEWDRDGYHMLPVTLTNLAVLNTVVEVN
jgi:hypothetical protein